MLPFTRQIVTSTFHFYTKHLFDLARQNADPHSLGLLLDKAYSMADQSYCGDITVFPPSWLSNLLNVFSNPSPERIAEFILTGERTTWPKLERVRNATRISRSFESCLGRLRGRFRLAATAG